MIRGAATLGRATLGRATLGRATLLLLAALAAGCGDVEPSAHASGAAGAAPVTRTAPASLELDATEPRALKTVAREPVSGIPGLRDGAFQVAARTPEITQYRCSQCHTAPLPAAKTGEAVTRTMHLDIAERHAPGSTMTCRTCHSAKNADHLRLNDGTEVPLDHAYRLCAQCHFQQLRDWIGGAHGKRLGGWRGTRVVMSCTACHNPHRPAIEMEWPVGFPRIPRGGAHQGGSR